MKTKYVLLCNSRGIFVGTDNRYAYFSGIDPNGRAHAACFEDEKEALEYGETILNKAYPYTYAALPVKAASSQRHVSAIEIIKAGHGEHIGQMINYLPTQSKMIH